MKKKAIAGGAGLIAIAAVIAVLYALDLFPFGEPSRATSGFSGDYVKAKKRTHEKVIVFVHGVTGDGKSTWRYDVDGGKKSAYWPELMREDRAYDGYDIYVVSYHSPFFGKSEGIVQLATKLNQALAAADILPPVENAATADKTGVKGKEDQPVSKARPVTEIVFVAHSMGNLIVRSALMIDSAYNRVSVPLVMSIASPSNGSSIAEVAHRFNHSAQFGEMASIKSNPFLQLLNHFWKNNPPPDIEVACAYEKRPVEGAVLVVDQGSATAVCTRSKPQGFEADHSAIVKPADRESAIYKWTTEQLRAPRTVRFDEQPTRWANQTVVIGGKDFLESNVLVAMMAFMINPDFPEQCRGGGASGRKCLNVEASYDIGGRDRAFEELTRGIIDLFPEYTGTVLANFPDLSLEESRDAKHHTPDYLNKLFIDRRSWKRYEVLPLFGFQNNYQMIMRADVARNLGLSTSNATISDLAGILASSKPQLKFKSTPDFFYRADGLRGLREAYRIGNTKFDFSSVDYTQHDKKYQDVRAGRAHVVDGYTTDPQLRSADFVKLTDDKKFWPIYYALPMGSRNLFQTFPHLRDALAQLAGKVSEDDMIGLLAAAERSGVQSDRLKGDPEQRLRLERLVKDFLGRKNLLPKS